MIQNPHELNASHSEMEESDSGNGFRSLWAAVLMQAVTDHVYPSSSTKNHERVSARLWLFDDHHADALNSFENVCGYLDLDPERIRAQIVRMSNNSPQYLKAVLTKSKLTTKKRVAVEEDEQLALV